MSAGDLAEPIRRPERPAARTSSPTSPWLRLVPSVPVDAPRAPFVVFVIGLLAVGLVGLLLLNTSLQKRAFEVSSLQRSTATLTDQQSELEQRAADLSAPEAVAGRAVELGMVPNGNPVFLRLGDGKVLGTPVPATRPAPVLSKAEKKVIKQAAAEAKAAAARAKAAGKLAAAAQAAKAPAKKAATASGSGR
jgi:hypothetical protein